MMGAHVLAAAEPFRKHLNAQVKIQGIPAVLAIKKKNLDLQEINMHEKQQKSDEQFSDRIDSDYLVMRTAFRRNYFYASEEIRITGSVK